MAKLGLIPNILSIVNSTHVNNQTHWHNFLQKIKSSIETGQTVGNPVEIVSSNGIVLPQSIKDSTIRVISSTSGDTTITANTQISSGFDNQHISIEGSDNTRTVTLQDGNGCQLQGGNQITLKNGYMLRLHYNKSRSVWIEDYRSINS